MGHQRLGKLPASKKWREIVAYLADENASVAELADRIVDACDGSLAKASKDPAFQQALHLLCLLPQAARADNLQVGLAQIGVAVPDNPSRTDIIVGFEKAIEKAQRSSNHGVTDLSEMAKQAGIAALNSILQQPAPAPQLGFWDEPKSDTHRILDHSATPDGFGNLAQEFFVNLASHNIKYFMHRELPKHLGTEGTSPFVSDMSLFDRNVDKHCREASYIMRPFARDWNANILYNKGTSIDKKALSGFAHVAMNKMRKEFKFRNAADERN